MVDGDPAEISSIELLVDAGSLRVIEGTGGDEGARCDDIESIQQTIDDEVLKREAMSCSRRVQVDSDGSRHAVEGDLTISAGPSRFRSSSSSERTERSAPAGWYPDRVGHQAVSALFGALKVTTTSKSHSRVGFRALIAVHGRGVEPTRDTRPAVPRAVRVEGDVLDRLFCAGSLPSPADQAPFDHVRLSGAVFSAAPRAVAPSRGSCRRPYRSPPRLPGEGEVS